jgi:peptidoglycan hydrolase CwlO-like protein
MIMLLLSVSVSCGSQNHKITNTQYADKNYLEGSQSDVNKNVEQLEKRRDADENKMDIYNYDVNKPK